MMYLIRKMQDWHIGQQQFAEQMSAHTGKPVWYEYIAEIGRDLKLMVMYHTVCRWRSHDMWPLSEWGDGEVYAGCSRCDYTIRGHH